MKDRPVLVVDDDDRVRRLVRIVLEADEWRVLEAADASAAFDHLTRVRPRVVVLDVMMPGIDGIELCRRLDHGDVKVLMLTARSDPDVERACKDAGADAFLTKPFSSITLLDTVEELSA